MSIQNFVDTNKYLAFETAVVRSNGLKIIISFSSSMDCG